MESKTNFLGVLLGTVFFFGILHTTVHVTLYGTGISKFYEAGVSGMAIGPINIDDNFHTKYDYLSPLSQLVLIAEWSIIALALVSGVVKGKIEAKREVEGLNLTKYRDNQKTKTDLDVLYDALKDKKQLRVSTIAKAFKIPKTMVLEWSKIFEVGKLATLKYPRFGEPSLALE